MPTKNLLSGPVTKVARYVGGALGSDPKAKGKAIKEDPLLALAVGVGTTWIAGKILPRRIAGLGAALAAGYVTTKLAQRAERKAVADTKPKQLADTTKPRRAAVKPTVAKPALRARVRKPAE